MISHWMQLPAGLFLSLAVALSGASLGPAQASEKVVLDVDPDHGACSTTFAVRGQGADLYPYPDAGSVPVLKLAEGYLVAGCTERDGWWGVIVGTDERCGIGTVLTEQENYGGPCPSGWVKAGRLRQVAG